METLIFRMYSTLRLTSFLGISTLELTMKNHFHGEVYPFSNSHYDTKAQVDNYLDLNQAAAMAQFMIVLILKLVMSPKLPFSVVDYGRDVEAGIQHFMGKQTVIHSSFDLLKSDICFSYLSPRLCLQFLRRSVYYC